MKKITYISILVCLTIASFTACDLFGGGKSTKKQIAQLTIEYDESTAKGTNTTKTFNVSEVFDLSDVANLVNHAQIYSLKFENVKIIEGKLEDCYPETSLTNLKTINIDDKISEIHSYAFRICSKLTTVIINANCTLGIEVFPSDTEAEFSGKVDITKYTSYTSATIPVTISFEKETGVENIPATMNIRTNKKLPDISVVPKKSKYEFMGYSANPVQIFNANGSVVTGTDYVDENGNWKHIGNVTLSAEWEDNYYTVVFNPNGGQGSMEPQKIGVGETVKLNKNTFTSTTAVFAYWETSGTDTTYTDEATVTDLVAKGNEVELKAVWLRGSYQVTYFASTATDAQIIDTEIVCGGDKATKCNIVPDEKPGYVFTGWYTKDGEEFTAETEITCSVDVYAHWRLMQYTVVFNPNPPEDVRKSSDMVVSGSIEPEKVELFYGDTLKLAEYPCTYSIRYSGEEGEKVPGYGFLGWSISKTAVKPMFKVVEKNRCSNVENAHFLAEGDNAHVTLYAVWETPQKGSVGLDEYEVNFCNNDDYVITLLTFDIYGTLNTYKQNNEDALEKLKNGITYTDKDGNSNYYLDGFYSEENGGVKLFSPTGELIEDTTDKRILAYIQKKDNGEYAWIGGNQNVYAHWVKMGNE